MIGLAKVQMSVLFWGIDGVGFLCYSSLTTVVGGGNVAITHELRWVAVASGAGRGECTCGKWRSRVSDDGYMFEPDYYSGADIEGDFAAHVKDTKSEEFHVTYCHGWRLSDYVVHYHRLPPEDAYFCVVGHEPTIVELDSDNTHVCPSCGCQGERRSDLLSLL